MAKKLIASIHSLRYIPIFFTSLFIAGFFCQLSAQQIQGTYSVPFHAAKKNYTLCFNANNFYLDCIGVTAFNGTRETKHYSGTFECKGEKLTLHVNRTEQHKMNSTLEDSTTKKNDPLVFQALVKNTPEISSIKLILPDTTITVCRKLKTEYYKSASGSFKGDSLNEYSDCQLLLSNSTCGNFDYGDYFYLSKSWFSFEGNGNSESDYGYYTIKNDSIHFMITSHQRVTSDIHREPPVKLEWTFKAGSLKGLLKKQANGLEIIIDGKSYSSVRKK